MRYKAVLWDFDGTLAYTGKDVWHSLEYAAGKWKARFPEAYKKADSNLGNPLKQIFSEIIPYPGAQYFQKFEELVRVHYREISDYRDTYFYPGISELLKLTREENVQNFVITMKPKEPLERMLRIKAWDHLFEGWLSPDSFAGKEQSKSEMIFQILGQLTIGKEQCVYIGDTWSDVSAAHENGIACIAVTYGDGDTTLLRSQKPEYVAEKVSDIQKFFNSGG